MSTETHQNFENLRCNRTVDFRNHLEFKFNFYKQLLIEVFDIDHRKQICRNAYYKTFETFAIEITLTMFHKMENLLLVEIVENAGFGHKFIKVI